MEEQDAVAVRSSVIADVGRIPIDVAGQIFAPGYVRADRRPRHCAPPTRLRGEEE